MELQGRNLGLWDYTLFEIGITEISFEIGIMDLKSNQIGMFHPCKLELRDFTLFEIWIMGLHQFWNWDYGITGPPPPYGGPPSGMVTIIWQCMFYVHEMESFPGKTFLRFVYICYS